MDGYAEAEVVEAGERGRLDRFRDFLARTEKIYLEILRAVALLAATFILAWIVWVTASSAYKISRDADAVEVAPVTLTAEEVADVPEEENSSGARAPEDARKNTAFEEFRRDYFGLYRSAFERYRKPDDPRLNEKQFEEHFLQGFVAEGDALEPTSGGRVDKNDYGGLLATMRQVASLPITSQRLKKYRDTPKVRVQDKVKRSRQETYCAVYNDYFGECYYYGTRTAPYTQTVARMELPAGIMTPAQLFTAYQNNYLNTLYSRRERAAAKADAEVAERLAANEEGWLGLGKALWLVGAFLGLMFFFLLVAIERHQRVIAAKLD